MRLAGLWPALLTPLHDDLSVDDRALRALVEDLISRGVDGVVPLGSTGEFTEFDATERRAILDTVVGAADGRVPVLAGVSGLSTRETCVHAAQAREAGADAVLVLPPLYWKVSDDRIVDHVAQVADAAGLPVVVYDFPALTMQPLTPAVLARLASEVPAVIGAKLTVRDLMAITAALTAVRVHRPDFAVVTGFEDLVVGAMWAGADGAVSGMANVIPDEMVALVAAVRDNNDDLAERYRTVLDAFDVYGLSLPAIPGLKAAAAAIGRIPRAAARLNAGPATEVAEAGKRWAAEHATTADARGTTERDDTA
ncbi:dihydrodipicolinate synthase family protein [Saccharomonospora sp. NPDC046836]|uniref:dihydrodipicolinate synthase family protein n=1 Tax=Saccharomonospora sp. NPDC046836 TaxID=3156921 RepID=UPI003407402A